jgi:hypothetical protein
MASGGFELSELTPCKLSDVSGGAVATETTILPDVCKTPSPGGPIPIPYPLQSGGDLLRWR